MPQTTTQAPAPVVRRPARPAAPQEIIPNPDGSLPSSVHASEYKDSYPVPRSAPKQAVPKPIPTNNPLTSLTGSGQTAPAKTAATPKLPAPPQASKPKESTAPSATPTKVVKAGSSQVSKPTEPQTAAQLAPGPFNRTIIVIDPAHGGTDAGARIADATLEKDVDLQFAFKLRSLLAARGFTVVLSRDSDTGTLPDKPDSPLTLDVRAGMANRQQAVACLLLHATGSGRGVHLYTSELSPIPAEPYAAPWLTAQGGWISQSLLLQKQVGLALTRANVPLVMSRASIRPVDSLTCPALVVELAPEGEKASSIAGDSYQQRVANAVATALIFWQNAAQPPARLAPPVYKAPPPQVKPATDVPAVPASSVPATPAPTLPPSGVQP